MERFYYIIRVLSHSLFFSYVGVEVMTLPVDIKSLGSLEPSHFVCLCFRIKIEEEYAKNLSKLSLSALAAQEEG